jgi:hypothetical protein
MFQNSPRCNFNFFCEQSSLKEAKQGSKINPRGLGLAHNKRVISLKHMWKCLDVEVGVEVGSKTCFLQRPCPKRFFQPSLHII